MSFAEAKAACEGRGQIVETNVRSMVKAGKIGAIEALLPGSVGGLFNNQQQRQQSQARAAYKEAKNWVFAATNVTAKRCAGQPWLAGHYKDAPQESKKKRRKAFFSKSADQPGEIEHDKNHPVLWLLDKPNRIQGKSEFIHITVMNLLLTGEFYWIGGVSKKTNGEQKAEVWAVPSSWMVPQHKEGMFTGYKLQTGYGDGVDIPPENVARGYFPDPSDIKGCMSPLASCIQAAKIDDYILNSQEASFERGINPNLIITIGKGIGPDGKPVDRRPTLKGAQRRQIVRAVRHIWSQTVNQGDPAILDGLIEDVKKLQNTPQEMDWKQSGEVVKARIFQAFGVNAIVVGEITPSNKAQAVVAETNFCGNVVNPILGNISSAASEFFGQFYDDGESLAVWLEEAVPKDDERDDRQWNQARQNNDITQEENRARLKLEPLPKKPPERSPLLNNPQTMTAIANLCAQVGLGAITHDAAVQVLVITLQIAEADAEAMIPKDPTPEEIAARKPAPPGGGFGGPPQSGAPPKKPPKKPAKGIQLDDDAIDRIALRLRQLGIGPSRGDRLGQHPKSPDKIDIPSEAGTIKYNENHDELGRFSSGSSQQSGSGNESSGASSSGSGGDSGGVPGTSGGVESSSAAAPVSTERLTGSPTSATIKGVGEVSIEPNIKIRQAAADYCKKAGVEYDPPTTYAKVDKERATKIANAYEEMKNDPEDPEVKAAYAAMAKETIDQYQAVLDTGLKVEFIDYAKQGDPYAASPRLAILDIRNNNHFWVFPTDAGFGSSDFDASKNPLLAKTDYEISGKPATVNDLFRIVHDVFGHAKEENGMRADGEENAWRSHSTMYSPLARRAMTTETRGQNSWVNFGPHASHNTTASGGETKYADQKVGLLPEWVMTEGAKAVEFIQFTKTVETKIARAAVKAAYAQQHTRVERQAAKELAKYFQKSVAGIISKLPSFKPDPENAKEQAASLIKRAFKASQQNDLLIASASQPVADAFLEGAYAEMRLSAAAKRRKKFLEQTGEKITTATQAAARADEEIDFPTTAPDWLKEGAQDYVQETFGQPYWLRIPETTRDDIEDTLARAIENGDSIKDIARTISEAHGDEYSMIRATMVARTEMTSAQNAGAVRSIGEAFAGTGLTPTKVWLSILSQTTRETHAEADSQEVLLDEEFTLAGQQCSFPGDARLTAEERINCQCSIISGEVESQISSDDEDGGKAFDPSEPRDEQGQWTSGGGSEPGVQTRIGKVTGNKEEADKLITHLAGIDKSHGGAIAAFLDKHPLKEIKVDTKGVPTMKTAKGLYQPDKQRIVIRPQDKMGNAFGFESGSTFSTDWAQAHDSDRGEYQRATFTHEFGHHVEMTLDKLDKTNEFRMSVIKNFMDEEKHVSAYSKTNFHEYFAESFAAYHLDKGKLSERAVTMIEDAIKRAKES